MIQAGMTVHALLRGTPVPFRDAEYSAIAKMPISGPVRIGWLGLEGDAVADRVHHGGWDKAIHLYPQDHYPFWRERKPGHVLLDQAGAFGENIASSGLTESEICIGDRFTLGSAVLEVSHGRQPCWKLDHRFGAKDVMATIVKTARCGIYFRVVQEGEADASVDTHMALIDRPQPEWPVERVFRLLIGGGHRADPAAVRELAAMPLLAEAWRERAAKLAG
ncbi:MOSC domain-containing protein [Sphingobium phenoxybenzoativorans]|uniref:MOSC domain-containing protein n=1 Tax=Sphingobium phenoxybenzoativorans TaxID=1592790 RepID=A0A975K380_9SPHN|nr:MOSC domain-containing protein [Sphingobium phenoxybenzoativorans]QUT04096.1 MOSC domain-containing protein [Sphingobium phenoxybenzoativorans]